MTTHPALTIEIPGEPVAQGRPRLAVVNGHARAYDPAKSRNWKATAQIHAEAAIAAQSLAAPLQGPVSVVVDARWTLAASKHKKRCPVPQMWRTSKPDADNVAKSVLDALTGIVWLDDAQVVSLSVYKFTAGQGEAPGVTVTVHQLEP